MNKKVVVLTGGIASGKSQTANYFAGLGCHIIDADQVAREVVHKGTSGWQALSDRFGQKILHPNGQIDRQKLRKMVFNDRNALADLNDITHPLIQARLMSMIEQSSGLLVMVVIPLLSEDSQIEYSHRVLVVDVPEQMQLRRLQARDDIDLILAQKMMAAQISRTERLKLADDIIPNRGTLSELKRAVKLIFDFYVYAFK